MNYTHPELPDFLDDTPDPEADQVEDDTILYALLIQHLHLQMLELLTVILAMTTVLGLLGLLLIYR